MSEKTDEITLIIKYLHNEPITDKEYIALEKWVAASKSNSELFKHFVEVDKLTNVSCKRFDPVAAQQKFKRDRSQINKAVLKRKKNVRHIFRYAAVFTGIISLAVIYYQKVHLQNSIDKPVLLKLDDGNFKTIDVTEDNRVILHKGNTTSIQKKDRLVYKANTKATETVYNELQVPYGRTFELVLSDGSRVYINSGTSFRYPQTFVAGKNREVFLMGEACFEVSKDEKHPFIVNTADLRIKVLGTKFNVSSYSNDTQSSTVLVKGKVSVYKQNGSLDKVTPLTVLDPGFKATWNPTDKTIVVEKVNSRDYIAWIKGSLVFANERFEEVIKKLERHYDVKIINKYTKLNYERYTGTFDTETIVQVLNTFKGNSLFRYEIKGNKIVIFE